MTGANGVGKSTLISLLLPEQAANSPLPSLLAWFAVPLVFGAWNALLARYAYAAGDTRQPLRCELLGSLVNVLLLGVLLAAAPQARADCVLDAPGLVLLNRYDPSAPSSPESVSPISRIGPRKGSSVSRSARAACANCSLPLT